MLTFLLKGKQPIIWVLARRLWTPRGVPKDYRAAIDDGRLLIVSPVSQSIRRVAVQSAMVRNRFILKTLIELSSPHSILVAHWCDYLAMSARREMSLLKFYLIEEKCHKIKWIDFRMYHNLRIDS